ncbi:glycosyltransferase involved in cell wall biosynthesis [Chitinophaga skermanii]|uniref:Glycosyltransferase involved in cell wall biosynthesis n=1 Tax=Chitinophaga skermanii TaxID=331697 RepID=A0A327QUN5_9BACT|nr:glycosyltransferase [Chitinophaga skermanii]RAJ08396.1 glycosyltransferase involved in cell wall biosynthesis [Chitinophaga skermanii]
MEKAVNMTAQPLVSFVIAAYNAADFVRETLESVRTQTYTNIEVLMVNDSSTDGTLAILQEYADRDARFIVINNTKENKGFVNSLNVGIRAAKGKYIARLDADDVCTEDRLAVQIPYLEANPSIDMVAAWIVFIDEHGKEGGAWDLDRRINSPAAIRRKMPKENCIAHPTVTGKTEVFKQLEYLYFPYNNEDHFMWLRVLGAGYTIGKVQQVLLRYRVHSNSMTQTDFRSLNIFRKRFNTKRDYLQLKEKAGKLSWFDVKVLMYMVPDMIMTIAKDLKRRVKHAIQPAAR